MMLNSYISISRNRFFVFSFIFVLLLLIALHIIYFEKFSRYVLKNDFSAKQFQLIKNSGPKIKIAAIGTSHTGDALRSDAEYFFNYGRTSTWYPQVAYAKVSHLLKYAPNLKVLLLEVDHISILGYDHAVQTSMPENHLYLLKHTNESLYEENGAGMNDKKAPFLLSMQPDVAPVIHRKYFQDYLVGRGKKKEVVSPWATLTPKEKMESAKKRTHTYHLDSPSEIDQSVRDYYMKAIVKAKELGVEVYLIFNPQTKEYLAEIKEGNHMQVDDFVSALSKEKRVTVLDYRHYFGLDESFFENQDHLNDKGSKALTEEVMKVIQNDL